MNKEIYKTKTIKREVTRETCSEVCIELNKLVTEKLALRKRDC
jgi:hypothetical protein